MFVGEFAEEVGDGRCHFDQEPALSEVEWGKARVEKSARE
jgi:hypothetical protein